MGAAASMASTGAAAADMRYLHGDYFDNVRLDDVHRCPTVPGAARSRPPLVPCGEREGTMDTTEAYLDIFAPDRWGLRAEAGAGMAGRLHALWTRFRPCFKTPTRDGSAHAWVYLRGLLTMPTKRTFANIARRVVDPADDGQALQQFMSDSPWSAQVVIRQVQTELAATPMLQHGGMLILDESPDAKAGLH